MVKLKSGEGDGEFKLIAENEIVDVRVGGVEPNEFTYKEELIKKLRWTFIVTDKASEFHGKEIWGDTSQAFVAHPNCRAYNWAAAIMGRQYGAGEEFDTDDLIGTPCRIMIMHKPDNKSGQIYMRAKEVFPASSATMANQGPKEAPY